MLTTNFVILVKSYDTDYKPVAAVPTWAMALDFFRKFRQESYETCELYVRIDRRIGRKFETVTSDLYVPGSVQGNSLSDCQWDFVYESHEAYLDWLGNITPEQYRLDVEIGELCGFAKQRDAVLTFQQSPWDDRFSICNELVWRSTPEPPF